MPDVSSSTPAVAENRRFSSPWARFSLRGLMFLTLLAALVFWHVQSTISHQHKVNAAMNYLASQQAFLGYHSIIEGTELPEANPPWWWLGDPHFFSQPTYVSLAGDTFRFRRFRDEDLKHVAILKNLEELEIQTSDFSLEGMKHLNGLKSVRRLSLISEPNGNDAVYEITWLHRVEELRIVLGDPTFDLPKLLSKCPNLTKLEIHYAYLTDQDVERIARLCPHIVSIQLHGSEITDRSFEAFLQWKKLNWVDVSGSRFSDEGIERFRERYRGNGLGITNR